MVYKWHQRFKDGGTDIFTDERKGRPQEVDTGVTEAELKGLNTDRKVTVLFAPWVPTLLPLDEKQRRVSSSSEFLRGWKKEGDTFLSCIITTDESWSYHLDSGNQTTIGYVEEERVTATEES
eukprot:XP_011428813.1 PREDICTED: uncharacterized protein LOC105329318 [Crassostrea gigas]